MDNVQKSKSHSAIRPELSSSGSGPGQATPVERRGSQYDDLPLPPVNTIHNFFKQQRKMNYQNYIHTKKHEKALLKKNRAAVCIQSAFRGWLVRQNFKILNKSAIKIQSLWRRALARMRYVKLDNERKEKRRLQMLNESAVKIQALFRGYITRKNSFNFKVYKEITDKNSELKKSVERINELEDALATHSDDILMDKSDTALKKAPSKVRVSDARKSSAPEALNIAVRSLEKILENNTLEELDNIAPSRLLEIFSEMSSDIASRHGSLQGSRRGSRAESKEGSRRGSRAESQQGSRRGTTSEGQGGSRRDSRAGSEHGAGSKRGSKIESQYDGSNRGSKIQSEHGGLKRGSKVESQRGEGPLLEEPPVDSDLKMFPDLLNEEGLLQTDAEKIDILKQATRNLHDRILAYEIEKFYKIHFLLRTAVIPGVYSDIYTNQLTEMERKLKSLKFWDVTRISPADQMNRVKKRQDDVFGGGSQPVVLSAEEQEEQMLKKIYDFKINYFLPPPEPEDLELNTPAALERSSTISLPAWRR